MFALPDKIKFKISKPLLAILVTTIILAGLLLSNTMRNLNREQKIMEDFLLDEGLTLIRSFEAGARTSMMHEMMGGDLPINTLVQETAKAERIAYIYVVTEDGHLVASAGSHDIASDMGTTRQVLSGDEPVITIISEDEGEPIFEVAAIFRTLPADKPPMMGMMRRGHHPTKSPLTEMLENGQAVIHLGLSTSEFIQARKQDFNHSLFMGTMLMLMGSCVFYFLFLYQGMWITRTTLANMKLYTRNIIESMPDGLLTLDSDHRIESSNSQVQEFTAMELEAMKGKTPWELFNGWPVEASEKQQSGASFSYIFRHPDGVAVPVEISTSSLRDEQGNELGSVLLLRDLREIRAMQEQLNRSRRLASLGRMAAGIAHEIRNPLGTLRGFAQYFGSQATDDASKEYSALMVGEVDRLNETISSLLQFSRPRDPEFTEVNLDQLLEKTCKLLEYDFSESEIVLGRAFTCSSSIEADGDLLLQVLLNLLKNGIQVSKAGDMVTLSCEEDSDHAVITVTDTGCGMTTEEKEQMFDPFFTTKKTGTGLGLAVSYQIIEQHHGSFTVRSSPGRGTSISITLPRQQNNPANGSEKRPHNGNNNDNTNEKNTDS